MKCPLNRMLLLFLAFAALFSCSARMLVAYRENELNIYSRPDLENRFEDNGDTDFYDTNLDMQAKENWTAWGETLAKTEITKVFTIYTGYREPPRRWHRLPCDVRYYTLEDGQFRLISVQEAGTLVLMLDSYFPVGNGVTSLPTQHKGWRLTRSFYAGTAESALFQGQGFYYVPTEDLEKLAEYLAEAEGDWLRGNPDLEGQITPTTTNAQLAHALLFYADAALYKHGVYCSPDFYHQYFDTTNIVLLSAAGVLLTLHVVLRVRRARQQRQVEGGRK